MADDDEDMQEHTSGNAGASLTYPMEAGSVKKNGMIIMKGDKPCKVRVPSSMGLCWPDTQRCPTLNCAFSYVQTVIEWCTLLLR